MEGQLSIFDFLDDDPAEMSLDDLPEEEMVKIVGNSIGVNFTYRDDFWGYEAKYKKLKFELHYSNYRLSDNTARFISAGYNYSKGGAGSPCDSIQEAVNFFRNAMNRTYE